MEHAQRVSALVTIYLKGISCEKCLEKKLVDITPEIKKLESRWVE